GIIGTSHADAEPLVEGVEDFQIAVGVDGLGGLAAPDGQLNDSLVPPNPLPDEWLGNGDLPNELPLAAPTNAGSTPPTNYWFTTQQPPLPVGTQVLRAIRVSLIVRSLNQYAGTPSQVGPLENRTAWAWPPSDVGPRWRQMRMVVAPRA